MLGGGPPPPSETEVAARNGGLARKGVRMQIPEQERRRLRRIPMPRRWWTRLLVAGSALAVIVAPAAWANHQFTDVPTASPHHADISAIASVGITGGCAPGLYCPGQAVTRDQMASFIRRGLPRTGSAGTTADQTLTTTFADIAQDSLITGGTAGGGGFVVLLGSFTVHGDVGTLPNSSRIEFRFVHDDTGFLSNVSEVSVDPSSVSNPSAAPMKQWVFTVPTGATETFSLQARVASVGGGTITARSSLITLIYIPFGPSGTSSPLGTQGAPTGPATNPDGTDG